MLQRCLKSSFGLLVVAAACAGPAESTSEIDAAADDVATAVDTADTATVPDTAIALDCPGGPRCPCVVNEDCDKGICLDGPGGRECAQGCVNDCPAGMTCENVPVGADLVQVCVATWGFICEPCLSSEQCSKAAGGHASECIDYGPTLGAYCGPACKVDANCPADYRCRDSTTIDGATRKACVKATNEVLQACSCDPRARSLQLSTVCEVTVETGGNTGVCTGIRSCSELGLSACSAAPTKEVCDSKDNDCNGGTDDGLCDDGNICTTDSCVDGTESCVNAQNSAACDDGNACTGADTCKNAGCVGQTLDCDDKNLCTTDSCDAGAAGVLGKGCTYIQTKNACDDGNFCTDNDLCDGAGSCVGLALQVSVTCNDNNVCTQDGCDPFKARGDGTTGCFSTAAAGACEDGNPCTNGDTCKGGSCAPGGNICSCTKDADCATKEDGDLCNGTLYCNQDKAPYFCELDPKTLVKCDTSKDTACLLTVCLPKQGSCTNAPEPDGKSCDADGSVCTLKDSCKAGKCAPGSALPCDDANVCTDDSCSPKSGCANVNNVAACEDGNKCTTGDACAQGNCQPGLKIDCDDKEGCTYDYCDTKTGKCVNDGAPHDGDKCDADGSVCTPLDTCKDGKCVVGKAKVCDDGNVCTTDSCDGKTGCVATSDNQQKCDADGKKCTPNDFCSNSVCKDGGNKDCDDKNSCTVDACKELDGTCTHAGATLDGETCDADGSLCTENDKCKAAQCIAGATKVCDDKNACTKDSCKDKSGCIFDKLTGDKCDDGDACTNKDLCVVGKCGGLKLTCNDNNPCTDDVCSETGCKYPPVADGTACGATKHCVKAQCVVAKCGDGYLAKGEQCDDGNDQVCDGCEACVPKQHLVLDGTGHARAAGLSPGPGGTAAALSITGDLTIEAWIRPAKLTGEQAIVSKANAKGGQLIAFRVGLLDGQLFFAHKRQDVLEIIQPKNTGKGQLKAGQWSHIAVVIAGAKLRAFIDGQPAGSATVYKARVDAPTADLVIGRAFADVEGSPYVGAVDAVHIANVPLFGGSFTPQRRRKPVQGTVSLWHFDTAVDGKVADEGPANIALALGTGKGAVLAPDDCYGADPGAAVCGDGKTSPKFETCDDQNSSVCDGCEGCQRRQVFDPNVTGALQTPPATDWASDVVCLTCSFTLEAWVKPTDTGGVFEIIGASCGALSLNLVQGTQGVRFGVVALGTPLLLSTTPVKKNIWYHVAGVAGLFKGAPMRIYVNGKLENESTNPQGLGSSYATIHKEVLFIGAGAGGTGGGCRYQGSPPGKIANNFSGEIDEVRVSAGARYGASFTPSRRLLPDDATRGLWHFDAPADQARDDSGQHVNTTLVGGKASGDTCFGQGAASAVCGDGQQALWETCDNGTANGPAPKKCSLTCSANSAPDCTAITWPAGKYASAKNAMQYGAQWTLEGWARLPALPATWGPIIGVWAKAGCPSMPTDQHWYVAAGKDGDDASRIGGPSQQASAAKRVWKAQVWQHFALQFDGAGNGSLWVDGELARTFTGVGTLWSASCPIYFGAFFDGDSVGLAGSVASLRLSKRARYGHPFAPPTSLSSDADSVWSFDFDEQTGTTATDINGIYKVDVTKVGWAAAGPGCTK